MSTTNPFQIDDIVSIKARVTYVEGDTVTLVLDTHFESEPLTTQATDVKLVSRPLKEGSPVLYGRKRAKGTFVKLVTDSIAVVLIEGGKPENAGDLKTVDAVTVIANPGTPDAPAAETELVAA